MIVETCRKPNVCSVGTTQHKSGLLMQRLYITNEQSEVIWQRILVRESGMSCTLNGKWINFQDTLGWFIKTIKEFSKIRDECFPYLWVISHKKALGLVMKI